ncbi:MAG: hypothetical protein QME47_03180, partial [Candidatus Thermoplasmatota archaeon]|nr:hypothetical protein [Candidatus Thermoplasmatota archaeon]
TIVCTYVKNGNYTENVTLQDSLPNPYPKGSEGTVAENYHIDIIYTVACGEQIHPPVETTVFSIIEGKHFERVAAHIDFFTCSKREFQNYISGKTYKYGAFRPNETSDTVLDSNLPEEGFIVFSNDDCVESKKIINVTIVLKKYRAWQSTITISSIEQSGSTIWVNGTAYSEFGIDSVWVKLDDETWRLANGTNTWTYNLGITRYYLGTHTIYARARDSWGEHYYALNSTDFDFENQLVDITITYPQAYQMINNTVEVSGKAIDPEGSRVEKIEVKLADRAWEPVKEEDRENHNWSITLNTKAFDNVKAVDDGEQKIWVKAFDGILYSVRSVLVIVDNNLPNISITMPSSGEKLWGRVQIEGDAFDVNEVKNIWLELNHTEREDSTRIDVQITQGERVHWDYLLDTTQFHEGIYNLSACAFDGLHTNLINITVIIDNNKPPEILYSPVNATIVIEENSTQEFRIIDAKDPENRGLTKYWYLQKKQITGEFSDWQNITDQTLSDSSIYLFKADYTSSGEYRIKVVVCDIYYYNNTKASSENTTQIWNLIVMNVNRIPQILAYTPLELEPVINELASLEFAIDCIDIDNDTIFINWSVNGILRYSSKIAPSTFIFNTDYKSSGDYIVEVNVSDCYDYILIKWLVKVKNVNRAPTAIFSPMLLTGEYLNITAPKYQTFVIESLSDEDDDNLTIVWRVNGEVIVHAKNATHYTHLFTEGGLWNVSVEIFDGETRILNYWLVNVHVEPSPTPPTFELGIAACAVLTAILIILSIKKLRKKS